MLVNIALIAALICGNPSFCSCIKTPPVEKAYRQAGFVMTGEVTDIQALDGDGGLIPATDSTSLPPRLIVVTFRVTEAFKRPAQHEGPVPDTVTIRTPGTGPACGVPFRRGKKYLVYGFTRGEQLWTSSCTRTKLLTAGEGEVEELKRLARRM